MPKIFLKQKQFAKMILMLAALVFVFLFAAQTAQAQEGGYMEGGMGAALQNFYQLITGTIYYIAGGLVALYLSTSALQWLINNQTTLIDFNNSFVVRGLQVTQSLADMLLLLAFVVAAFGIIFKMKEFEAKKTIGNLVMVAIATRFGPLAVKMIVDVGNVVINTIVNGNDQLLSQVTSVLMADMLNTVGTVAGVIAVDAILLAIPWVNIFALGANLYAISSAAAVAIGYDSIATNLAGNATLYFVVYYLVKMIFQLVVSYTLSGVYLIYITIFASRIFMIQILAVVSPLAIFSLALPQTKRFFTDWWKSLFKWTFVGVWALFFLMLGIGSTGFIFPENPDFNSTLATGVFSGMGVDQYMLYYIFLIIFLSLVADMAQKDMNMGSGFKAAMLGVGAAGYAHIVKPMAGQIQGKAMQKYGAAQSRLDSGSGGIIQNFADEQIIKRGAGFLAGVTDAKTMSSWGTIFAGDKGKSASGAAAGATSIGKNFNAKERLKNRMGQIDKKLSIDDAAKLGTKIRDDEAMSALQRSIGDPKEVENTKKIYEAIEERNKGLKNKLTSRDSTSAGDLTDAMLAQKRLTTDALKAGVSAGYIPITENVIKTLNEKDRNEINLRNIRTLRGGEATSEEDKQEEKMMRMWAITYKDAGTRENAFQNMPSKLFEESTNSDPAVAEKENRERKQQRLALLSNADTRTLGKAEDANPAYYQKLINDINEMNDDDLKNFAKVNPYLLRQMTKTERTKYDLPASLRGNDGLVDPDKLNALINPNFKPSAPAAPATSTPATARRKPAISRQRQTTQQPPTTTAQQNTQTPPQTGGSPRQTPPGGNIT